MKAPGEPPIENTIESVEPFLAPPPDPEKVPFVSPIDYSCRVKGCKRMGWLNLGWLCLKHAEGER